eukprot:CAMPEP_0204535206 /NCGR_PEP_ID=MMETSP0661-20131031/13533_1 /ASSEMBLY_ACC=CAM_ASM_000606 /TAXON_ID=109239 /ORGANISM="Alexandrium margalefi, Strain AMGDE01CS-322" /LENGTH=182 /DNA_ID=CAMNT_0051541693 /DNA_START=87 /DNA_END=632 /DNA_ORIENTATION=-
MSQGPVVANRGREDGGEDGVVLKEGHLEHLAEHPRDVDALLSCQRELPGLYRPAGIQGRVVLVVVGLDDLPVCVGHPILDGRHAVAEPGDERHVGGVLAATGGGDDGPLIEAGPRHDVVHRRHELGVVECLHRRLEVRGRLHDPPGGEHEALAAVLQAVLHVGLDQVVASVLLVGPAAEAHA